MFTIARSGLVVARQDSPLLFRQTYWGYIGIMENKMETTIMGYIGIIGYILEL